MRLAKAPKIAFSFPQCFTRLRGDLPYKGSLARSFFLGGLKKGVLGRNKKGAGRGAGASTAELCEACDAGGDQQAGKIQLRQDLFVDMNIGRSCSSPRAFRPFRSHHLPCFPGVVLLRCSTPTARRFALSPSAALARSSHTAARNVRRC